MERGQSNVLRAAGTENAAVRGVLIPVFAAAEIEVSDSSGSPPQFQLLWGQSLGRILTEERAGKLVDKFRAVTGSHDEGSVEPQ